MTESILRLEGLVKSFGGNVVVKDLSLELRQGEMVTLLGPSGCGKTTTLRLVAGLERSDAGEIHGPEGRVLASVRKNIFVPPYKRRMGMVFQSYAIWPHMTVFENVAYPLRLQRLPRDQVRERVVAVLKLVGLAGLESRPAPMLSGGQQQRVALARAIVAKPDLLLLDEPFSNLDTELRRRMRHEMRVLQRELGLSIILVTHDQVEALSLSDRIVVMNEGVVQQIGAPSKLYTNPATPFVRDFLGRSVVIKGTVEKRFPDGAVEFRIEGYPGAPLLGRAVDALALSEKAAAWLTIRPEDIAACTVESAGEEKDKSPNTVAGIIDVLLFVGERNETRVMLDGGQLIPLYLSRSDEWTEGRSVELTLPSDKITVWPA